MINIVFGKPGAGKTAFMVSRALEYLKPGVKQRERLQASRNDVEKINDLGYNFDFPYTVPVYSNFPIRVYIGYGKYSESLYIDGFHLGFENENVPIIPVFPNSVIFLSEAQRYYNSRKSKDLPDWISRWYEEHRHFGIDVWLDVQRPGLIDLNIRELCGRFYEIEEVKSITDDVGNVKRNVFTVKEFGNWATVDKYLSNNDVSGATKTTYVYEGNVFEAYKSKCYFNQFIPTSAGFSDFGHINTADGVTQSELGRELYSQLPPKGFYSK